MPSKSSIAPLAARLDPELPCADQLYPNALKRSDACGGVTVIPGDIIVDRLTDGWSCFPSRWLEGVEEAQKHHEWEVSRAMKLTQGAALQRYYPLIPVRSRSREPARKPTES